MLRQFASKSSQRILSRFTAHSVRNPGPSIARHFSNVPPPPTMPSGPTPNPPTAITKDMAFGIQRANELFINHGLGNQKLAEIGKEAGNVETLVSRWQRMMEAFLGTQVHVLAGLGYAPNETGLRE